MQLLLHLCARQAAIGAIHREEQLGRQHIRFAFDACQRLAENRFSHSLAIDVRGIEEIDSEIERTMNAREGYLLALRIGECQPRAEANFRNQKITISQLPILHRTTPTGRPDTKGCASVNGALRAV